MDFGNKNTKEWVGYTGFLNVSFTAPFTPAVEIGWRLNSSFWNRGYATEAAFVCLNYGFERFGFSKIVSFTSVLNTRSESVMKKIGLKKSDHFIIQIFPSNIDYPSMFFTKLPVQNGTNKTFFLLIFFEIVETIC